MPKISIHWAIIYMLVRRHLWKETFKKLIEPYLNFGHTLAADNQYNSVGQAEKLRNVHTAGIWEVIG